MILHHGVPVDPNVGPNLKREDRDKNFVLAMKWQANGLLALVRDPPHQEAYCRIFNAYKNAEVDRQIGDRRLPNAIERHLQGPSKNLHKGFMMT